MPLDRGNSDDDESSDEENESAESIISFREIEQERREELDKMLTMSLDDMLRIPRFRKAEKERRKELDEELTRSLDNIVEELKQD